LYEGGLNRSYFLPFLDLLQRHCIVYEIQSNLDYRRVLASCSSFFGTDVELQPIIRQVLQTIVQVEEDDVDNAGRPLDLPVGFQRTIHTDYSYESVHSNLRAGRFDFGQLCDADVGSLDYKAIANHFDIVCLEHVPIMDLEGHNRARRFITLVDELYESKCCLVLSTLDEIDAPMALFRVQQDSHRPDLEGPTTELGVDVATQGGVAVGSLASVRELSFAFERASSRIVEMCSRSWWDKRLGHLDDRD
jgi:predicted ATPase